MKNDSCRKLKCVFFTSLVATACLAADYEVSEPGTVTFPSPVSYDKLYVSAGAKGPVLFDQKSFARDADHANSFTAYDAVSSSDVTFSGGWWDFGAVTGTELNFYTVNDAVSTPSGRTVTFTDSAVVTNIGTSILGGRKDGVNNVIGIRDGAAVWMNRLVLGQRQGNWQRNRCLISAGGSLTLRELDFSDSYRDNYALYYSENQVVVSNATSRLTVTGDAYLSRLVTSDATAGTAGGNTLVITDGARASIPNLHVNCAVTHGVSNRVVVSQNAVLLTDSCEMGNNWSTGPNCGHLDRFEVLDGACYTNTGSFVFGYIGNESARSGSRAETLIVSNATFVTKNFGRPKNRSGVEYVAPVFSSAGSTIVLSGTNTVFSVTENSSANGYTDRPLFGWDDCTLVVEDGMALKLWNWGFSWDRSTRNNTVCVRSGGKLTSTVYAVTTGSWKNNVPCYGNRLLVEDGGTVSMQYVWVSQRDSLLFVSNGTVTATAYRQDTENGTISVGGAKQNNINQFGAGSNCVLRVAGDRPKVTAANGSIIIVNHSRIAFDLPAGGYADDVIPVTTGDRFHVDATSFIDVSGIRAVRRARFGKPGAPSSVRYKLVKAKYWLVDDAILVEANSRLPEGVTLSHVVESGSHYLVCDVEARGLCLIFR